MNMMNHLKFCSNPLDTKEGCYQTPAFQGLPENLSTNEALDDDPRGKVQPAAPQVGPACGGGST